MKVKMSVDSTKLKTFFARHVEKVALGICFLVFLQMCYAAYGTKPFETKPEDLRRDTQAVSTYVESLPIDLVKEGIVPFTPEIKSQVEVASKRVEPLPVPPIVPPLHQNKVRRDEPSYLAVRELRAEFGFGYVQPHAAGPDPGRQWIVVTGLIPFAAQTDAFKDKFDNAIHKDPVKDSPKYDDYVVERSLDGGKTWEKLNLDEYYDVSQQFATERVEFVEKKFIDPVLCEKCPPLKGTTHTASVAHETEIPYVVQMAENKDAAAAQPAQPGAPADGRRNRRGPEAAPAAPVPGAPNAAGAQTAPPAVTYKLFRFFDYKVEALRSYCYRVKLILKNPNEGLPDQYLRVQSLKEGATRESPFSDKSDVVGIPRDFRMLAGTVTPGAGANEPTAQYLVIKWVPKYGVEVSHQFIKKERGTILNDMGVQCVIPIPGTPRTTSGAVDFQTTTLLVDMVGGDKIPGPNGRPVRAPAELVMMGPDGSIVIRNQLIDGAEYTREFRPGQVAGGADGGGDDAAAPAPGQPAQPKGNAFDFFKPKK